MRKDGGMLKNQRNSGFAVIEQDPLERPGHVPAVLDHPDPLIIQRARPPQKLPEPVCHRVTGPL